MVPPEDDTQGVGKFAEWLGFEAIPRAMGRQLPRAIRIIIGIGLLVVFVVAFLLFALLSNVPNLQPP